MECQLRSIIQYSIVSSSRGIQSSELMATAMHLGSEIRCDRSHGHIRSSNVRRECGQYTKLDGWQGLQLIFMRKGVKK